MGKRKSCDLCTLKKIKCDGLAPRCSRCIDYDAQCSWTPGIHRRVRGPPASHATSKPSGISRAAAAPSSSSIPLIQLEARLSELEAEMMKLRAAAASAAASAASATEVRPGSSDVHVAPITPDSSSSPGASSSSAGSPTAQSGISRGTYTSSTPTSTTMSRTKALHLPLRKDFQSVVDDYFTSVNCCYPIFDPTDFDSILDSRLVEHDTTSICRDEATWAAISIVLALGLQSRTHPQWSPCGQPPKSEDIPETQYLRNAQSQLEALLSRTGDLKGIQVLLGIALYISRTGDPTPSQYLIASAVKMSYRLGLHASQSAQEFGQQVCAERNRLFWIVYILDRDMSMTMGDPYLMQDHDYSVDMPSYPLFRQAVGDSALILHKSDHDDDDTAASLRCRISLANIQGRVYDYVYSTRAQLCTPLQQKSNLETIWSLLSQWSSTTLPQELGQPDYPTLLSDPPQTETFVLLYFTYFRTLCRAARVHSHNTDWMRGLVAYSARWSIEFDPTADPAPCPLPPVPEWWDEIVRAARVCMRLHHGPASGGGSGTVAVRVLEDVACAYVAALVVLVADKLTVMEHHHHHHQRRTAAQEGRKLLGAGRGVGDGSDIAAGGDYSAGGQVVKDGTVIDDDTEDDELIARGIERLGHLPQTLGSRKYDLYNMIARACLELNARADAARTAFEYIVRHFAPSAGDWSAIV